MSENYSDARAELLALINELAIVREPVVLSSGANADYYIDLRRITLHHRGAPLLGQVMLEHLADIGLSPLDGAVDAVGGLTLGADPIAAALLHAAAAQGGEIDAFVVRKAAKEHGMRRQIEGPSVTGRRVVVVEDTTTTGSSPIAAIEAVWAAGGQVLAVATIADRDTGARERIEALGVAYHPIFALADLDL